MIQPVYVSTTKAVEIAILRSVPLLPSSGSFEKGSASSIDSSRLLATATVTISVACRAHRSSVSDIHLGHLVDRLLCLADTVASSPAVDRVVFRCRASDGNMARVTGSKSLLCAVSEYFAASECIANAQAYKDRPVPCSV